MRTDVVFLSAPDSLRLYYGSTFLRGRQLTELLATRLSDDYSITFTTDSQQTDSVVILTKGYLASASPQSLADLKAGRNVLLADPVDLGMPAADLVALAAMVDGFVASSKLQMAALQKQFPEKPCHLVTHNVDQRLPVFEPPSDRLRLAYVGLLQNCRYLSELGQLAEILETPSGGSADSWMARLPEFNCHYIDRPAAAELRGVFHITGGGDTNWAGFATAVLAASAAAGGLSARVMPIATLEYPTAARRPANSRLDNSRLARIHGVQLPHWQHSLQGCIERLVVVS